MSHFHDRNLGGLDPAFESEWFDVVSLGSLIAYQAYRSYRRSNGRPMLFVSIGFLFISVGSVIEGILYEFDVLTIYQASTIQTGIVAIGMLFVLYSLYGGSMQTEITIQTDE